jgi:hypothetical protein
MKNFLLKNDELVVLREVYKAERNLRAAYKINAVIFLGIMLWRPMVG